MPSTASSQKALAYLKAVKPNDGWSIETISLSPSSGNKTDSILRRMKLLRRNVPVSDTSFLDIHYDVKQQVVVGVLTKDGSTCQVLVDGQTKKPVSQVKIVSCPDYQYIIPNTNRSGEGAASSSSFSSETVGVPQDLSPQEKQLMEIYVKNALIAMAVLIAVKVLFSTMFIIVVLPLLYGFLYSTCPPMESFDAKQQLKRVLRGYHLSDTDPRKPKGVLEEWTARLAATVTTELATLPGYSVEMLPLGGAAIWTSMSVPTANLQCYWIGANHQWYYIGSRELDSTTTMNATSTRPQRE
ncbi:hypothetical protein IV203_032455 [Nitzschia inconspicua]|uniref:Uncharacterized protein n=1 Tax=Nitzschia inconspicua TaxID=303405 RepID=A0A9K3PHA7_9STRA|nr:hypothetical protein IV203_032455 [Nitzschia inconspicua]